jgi:hypothetical protein
MNTKKSETVCVCVNVYFSEKMVRYKNNIWKYYLASWIMRGACPLHDLMEVRKKGRNELEAQKSDKIL